MTKISTATRLSLALAFTVGACVAVTPRAGADPAPTATDVVGVGSDIVQNSMGFLADGDIHGNDGYNTTGNKNRLVSFDATADGNGRNAFSDPTLGTPAALNPTVILRAGTSPVQRPNGGTAGLNALVNDSAGEISFVRSPNLPTAAQQATATSNLGSALHTIQFAQDKQVIATAATTNAPSALSVNELLNIYNGTWKHWNDLPGNSGGSSEAIIPLIPQPGAGVRTIFLNALKAANGGATVTPAGNVLPVQQNDPTTITGLSAADQKNAIVPFPVGRFKLLNDGYFRDPNAAYNSASPPAALSANGIDLQTSGTAPDNGTAFAATLPYYVVFRESDYASTTPWQPGSDLNWVQELFFNPGGPDPYVKTAPAAAILTAAGITAHYADLGNTSSG
jgi:ABC-type phosphate transport system substrate-binding protein